MLKRKRSETQMCNSPRLVQKISWLISLGAKVRTFGKPLRKDVFFVDNHPSGHDIPILARITGTAFIAQVGMRDWPTFSWLAKLDHTIFRNRIEKHNVTPQVAELRHAIAENWSVSTFSSFLTLTRLPIAR